MDVPEPHRFVAHVIEEADNKIHDDDVARRFGFSGALVPGVELFARITTPLVATWGERWLRGGRVDVRFRRPVYDGEELFVELTDDELAVLGPDGVARCVGAAGPAAERPDLSALVETSSVSGSAAELVLGPIADPTPGPFVSVHQAGTVEENEWYLDAVGEPLTLYRERSWAHPGLLLRLVNTLLMQNVALGPWIHTASRCRFLGVAHLPALMAVHGRVTAIGRRGGHDEVRYDALVLADDEPVLHVHHTALYRLATD